MLLRERSMAHCFALDAGPCKDANGGNKGINNDVHRLEPMQGKEPAHFLAHFLRHSSSTSGDQGGGFSSEARLWRASDSLFFMIIAFLILLLEFQSLEFLLLF